MARWHYVLTNLVRDGAISRRTAAAQRFPRLAAHPADASWGGYRGYLMQMVEQELESRYGLTAQQVFTGGLHITTTFSQSMMLLTAVEQAGALATLADGGVYHAPHVIARLDQGGTAIPLRIARHRVLSPGQEVAVDEVLGGGDPAFDSAAGGLAGATISVPGNFGAGAGAPYWFSGAGPGYSMSVGLFAGSPAGSLLPAAIWKTFQARAAVPPGLPPAPAPGW
ncbi:MAG: hypothetical protein ACRDPO_19265 [Streptosporangiaceae bacterium]